MADASSNPIMTPTTSTTQATLPDWYTNYAQQVLSNQTAIANRPYTPFAGPQVAGFTDLQNQAFAQTPGAAFAYQPGLQQATSLTQNVNPMGGLSAAQPYLSAAAQTTPSQINQYMNPYQQQVIDRIGTLGARTLQEQVLPTVRDKFISGGTYGGSRNAEIFGNKVRDAMEGISAAQSQALQTGYTNAQTAAQADLTRQVDLARTAGTLGQEGTSAGLTQGSNLATLAGQAQSMGLTGAGALQSMGATQQALNQANINAALADYKTQQAYPQAQNTALAAMVNAVKSAVPTQAATAGLDPATTTTQFQKTLSDQIQQGIVTAGQAADIWSKFLQSQSPATSDPSLVLPPF